MHCSSHTITFVVLTLPCSTGAICINQPMAILLFPGCGWDGLQWFPWTFERFQDFWNFNFFLLQLELPPMESNMELSLSASNHSYLLSHEKIFWDESHLGISLSLIITTWISFISSLTYFLKHLLLSLFPVHILTFLLAVSLAYLSLKVLSL